MTVLWTVIEKRYECMVVKLEPDIGVADPVNGESAIAGVHIHRVSVCVKPQ